MVLAVLNMTAPLIGREPNVYAVHAVHAVARGQDNVAQYIGGCAVVRMNGGVFLLVGRGGCQPTLSRVGVRQPW